MQINKEIHTALTVGYRYAKLHEMADNTAQNLNKLRFEVFADMLNEDQLNALKRAHEVCNFISASTIQYDAEQHLKTIPE